MLILSRSKDEGIFILDPHTNRNAHIKVVDIRGQHVRIGVDSHRANIVHREEICDDLGALGKDSRVLSYTSHKDTPGIHSIIGKTVRGTVNGTADVVRQGVVTNVIGNPTDMPRLLIMDEHGDYFCILTLPIEVLSSNQMTANQIRIENEFSNPPHSAFTRQY